MSHRFVTFALVVVAIIALAPIAANAQSDSTPRLADRATAKDGKRFPPRNVP